MAELNENKEEIQDKEETIRTEDQYSDDRDGGAKQEESTTEEVAAAEEGGKKESASKDSIDPEEVERIRKALAKANKEAQERRHKLNEWDELGIDPDTVKKWKEERDKEELRKAEEEGRYQEIIEKTRANATKDVEKALQERDSMKAQLESYLVDKNLTEAIAAEEGIPKLLQGIAKQYVKTVQDEAGGYQTVVVDEDGLPRKTESGEAMTVRQLVQSFKEDPDLSYAFKAPKISGNGSDSQGSGTPPSKKPGPKPKKSEMTNKQKQDFVAKYGYAEFSKLPR